MSKIDTYAYEIDLDDERLTPVKIIKLVGEGRRVLELGAASGHMSRVLKEKCGCAVVGVEIDPRWAEEARPYCERVIVGDLEQLDFAEALGEDRFDVILCADVLEHLRDPWRVLAEVRTYLKPGGEVVISVPNAAFHGLLAELCDGKFSYRPKGMLDETHLRFFTRHELELLVLSSGLIPDAWDQVLLGAEHSEFAQAWEKLTPQAQQALRTTPDGEIYQLILRAHVPAKGDWDGYLRVWEDRAALEARRRVEMEGSLAAREGEIAAMKQHIAALEQEVAARGNAIREKAQALREREGKSEAERTEFDRYVQRLWASLTSLRSKEMLTAQALARQSAVTQSLRQQLAVKDAESAGLAVRFAEQENNLRGVLGSRSWRITGPLRALIRLLRGGEEIAVPSSVPFVAQPAMVESSLPAVRSPLDGLKCTTYQEFLACFRPCDDLTDEVRWAMRAQIDAMKLQPDIAVRFSLLGLDDELFQRAFDAVRYQLYPRWELYVVDGEFASKAQLAAVREAMAGDGRIRLLLEKSPSLGKEVTPPRDIERDFTYVLTPATIPAELTFYRLAFFLAKHSYVQSDQATPEERYTRWMDRYGDLARAEIRLLKSAEQALPACPLISVIMPVYNTPEKWLRQAIESVRGQFYRNWELCIADDCSPEKHVRAVLDEYRAKDERIKVAYGDKNLGVAGASNVALHLASGDFVVLMDHDDVIEKLALYRVAESIVLDAPDMLYSDEAVVDEDNKKVLGMVFRPAFSKEFLRAHPYIVHMAGFRREFLLELGGFDDSLRISHDYDLMLRASERARAIVHIPEALYRWRTHKTSTGHAKLEEVTAASLKILERHLERCGDKAEARPAEFFNYYDIRYPLQPGLKVAIVIPTKNHGELVRQCIDSIVRTVKQVAFEIVLIDHDSDDATSLEYFRQVATKHKVLNYSGPFNFSSINNFAISQLDGSYSHYLFCNNDIEAVENGWLERMVELGQQTDVGVVGAKLFYPDRQMIQHAGVVVGMNGIAGHAGQFMGRIGADGNPEKGYLGRLIAAHEQMAVTAACMLVRRDAFELVHGYDEELAVGFGDTDLCLRIFQAGYRVLYCPHAELVHHESYTRGKSTRDPHPEDSARFKKKWAEVLENGDPYYNPNVSITCSWWDFGENPVSGMQARRRVYRRDGAGVSGGRMGWR